NRVPTRPEAASRFSPRERLGPTREEPTVGMGERRLARGPWNQLGFDATPRAVDAAHAVQAPDRGRPQREEVELALGERVVPPTLLAAAAADGSSPAAWP